MKKTRVVNVLALILGALILTSSVASAGSAGNFGSSKAGTTHSSGSAGNFGS